MLPAFIKRQQGNEGAQRPMQSCGICKEMLKHYAKLCKEVLAVSQACDWKAAQSMAFPCGTCTAEQPNASLCSVGPVLVLSVYRGMAWCFASKIWQRLAFSCLYASTCYVDSDNPTKLILKSTSITGCVCCSLVARWLACDF